MREGNKNWFEIPAESLRVNGVEADSIEQKVAVEVKRCEVKVLIGFKKVSKDFENVLKGLYFLKGFLVSKYAYGRTK